MPFVASVHLNEIALAALHQTIHNDTGSTLNLGGPLYILTTAENTLQLTNSLCSFSPEHSNISRNTLTGYLLRSSASLLKERTQQYVGSVQL